MLLRQPVYGGDYPDGGVFSLGNELELTKRDLERLQSLGPFVNLFTTEVAGPAVMRALDICQRRRLIGPPPPAGSFVGCR